MRRNKTILLILLAVPFLLYMSSSEEAHPSQIKDFLGKLVNFLLLFGGLAYLLRKPLGSFLQERAGSLANSIRGAEESREEAVQRLNDVESRLERLEEEIDRIRNEAEIEGQSLYQRMVEDARKDGDRMKHFARAEIEMMTRDAVREIKEFTAALAADLAREKIQELVTEAHHSALIDKSIERIEKLHEKSNPGKKVRARTH